MLISFVDSDAVDIACSIRTNGWSVYDSVIVVFLSLIRLRYFVH